MQDFEVTTVEGEPAPPEEYNFFERPAGWSAEKFTSRHATLLAEMLLIVMSTLYVEMSVVPALPTISQQWAEDAAWAPWVLSAYNIVGAVWTPISGSLADIFGPKMPALGSLVLYLIGQIGCALSNNMAALIVFRAFQGFGMGVFSLCLTMIGALFPPKFVPLCIGLTSSMFSIGVSIGLVGGAATMNALPRWQDVFWTTMPFVVLLTVAFGITLPNNIKPTRQRRAAGGAKKRRVDWPGAALLTLGVTLLLAGLTLSEMFGWAHAATLCLIVVAIVLLVVFVILEYCTPDPLMPVRLIASRDQLCNAGLAFAVGYNMLSIFQSIPYLLLSADSAVLAPEKKTMLFVGVVMLPFGIVQVLAPPVGIIGKRTGFAVLGTVFSALLLLANGLLIAFHYTLSQLIGTLVVYGLGVGCVMVAINSVIHELAPPEHFGALTSANTLCRIIGMAVGPITTSLAMNSKTVLASYASMEVVTDQGFSLSFIASAIVAAFGMLFALGISGQLKLCIGKRGSAKVLTSPAPTPEPASTPAISN